MIFTCFPLHFNLLYTCLHIARNHRHFLNVYTLFQHKRLCNCELFIVDNVYCVVAIYIGSPHLQHNSGRFHTFSAAFMWRLNQIWKNNVEAHSVTIEFYRHFPLLIPSPNTFGLWNIFSVSPYRVIIWVFSNFMGGISDFWKKLH